MSESFEQCEKQPGLVAVEQNIESAVFALIQAPIMLSVNLGTPISGPRVRIDFASVLCAPLVL